MLKILAEHMAHFRTAHSQSFNFSTGSKKLGKYSGRLEPLKILGKITGHEGPPEQWQWTRPESRS